MAVASFKTFKKIYNLNRKSKISSLVHQLFVILHNTNISNIVLHRYIVCEQWLSVLPTQGVFFSFLSVQEEMYSFYIHSCWPFIAVGFFCLIGRPCAEQEGFLLSTETQINSALNQINVHL